MLKARFERTIMIAAQTIVPSPVSVSPKVAAMQTTVAMKRPDLFLACASASVPMTGMTTIPIALETAMMTVQRSVAQEALPATTFTK